MYRHNCYKKSCFVFRIHSLYGQYAPFSHKLSYSTHTMSLFLLSPIVHLMFIEYLCLCIIMLLCWSNKCSLSIVLDKKTATKSTLILRFERDFKDLSYTFIVWEWNIFHLIKKNLCCYIPLRKLHRSSKGVLCTSVRWINSFRH